jgi:PadR family transcriptional regulator PadR
MTRRRRPSPQTARVLRALARDPSRWRYGYELGVELELPSGSLYPILVRLSDRELLEASWEVEPPAGRPRRHLYRLTASGLAYAAEHVPAHATTPNRRQAPVLGSAS